MLLGFKPCRIVLFLSQYLFQAAQLTVTIQYELQGRLGGIGNFLFDKSQRLAALQRYLAAVGLDLAAYEPEQGRFAAAIGANQTDALVGECLKICRLKKRDAALQIG